MDSDTVVLEIERIVAGGFGLARTGEGTTLVRGALPGERVVARPRRRAGVLRAHAIEIVEPHPRRVDLNLPPGADLPLEYEAQLPIKEELVREALTRVAKIEAEVEPIRPSPVELGYRTAAQYVVLPGRGLAARAPGSRRPVLVGTDPLAAPPLQAAFEACSKMRLYGVHEVVFRASLLQNKVLAGLIGDKRGPFERIGRALLEAGVAGVSWSLRDPRGRFRGRTRHLGGSERMLEDFGGVQTTVTVQSFSQINPPAAGALYREAAALAGSGHEALDLYAGGGLLALHMAPSFEETVAVEISADAIARGKTDAKRLRMPSVRFHRGDARTAERMLPCDVVAVNPPRAGLTEDVVELLLDRPSDRIVYVSCDPATWARDVARLCAGGYRLSSVRPFDFYPYTHHVEVLSLLERA